MPPRKRKHDDDEEEEDSVEAENGVRGKRKAAMAARAKAVVTHDDDSEEEEDEGSNDEDDENDEDFDEEEEEDEDEEVDESKEDGGAEENEEENEEDDDEEEDVDADAIKVECVEAVLDEPTKDVPGYVLKSKEEKVQKLEMWFSEEMSETVGDITEAFSNHYENNKLPVLQVTKFDVIEERDEIYQIDVLEAKYDKAYSIREKEEESDESNLAHSLYCLIRVDGKEKTWATQYFMPEEEE